MIDISVSRDGSLFIFTPHTEVAREWLDGNVASEPWQWLGASLIVDHRFAADLAVVAQRDGLELE